MPSMTKRATRKNPATRGDAQHRPTRRTYRHKTSVSDVPAGGRPRSNLVQRSKRVRADKMCRRGVRLHRVRVCGRGSFSALVKLIMRDCSPMQLCCRGSSAVRHSDRRQHPVIADASAFCSAVTSRAERREPRSIPNRNSVRCSNPTVQLDYHHTTSVEADMRRTWSSGAARVTVPAAIEVAGPSHGAGR